MLKEYNLKFVTYKLKNSKDHHRKVKKNMETKPHLHWHIHYKQGLGEKSLCYVYFFWVNHKWEWNKFCLWDYELNSVKENSYDFLWSQLWLSSFKGPLWMFHFTTVLTFINLNIRGENFQKPSEQNALTAPEVLLSLIIKIWN